MNRNTGLHLLGAYYVLYTMYYDTHLYALCSLVFPTILRSCHSVYFHFTDGEIES